MAWKCTTQADDSGNEIWIIYRVPWIGKSRKFVTNWSESYLKEVPGVLHT